MAKPKKPKQFFHPYPKYLQIADLLRNRIATELQPGDQLPPEVALGKEFGVSRETVRQALAPLEREGLITRTRGRGSIVSARSAAPRAKRLTGMTEDMVALGLQTHACLIDQAFLKANGEPAQYLNVAPDSPLVQIDRLRYFDGTPLSFHSAFLPLDVGARVLEHELEHTSIVLVLESKLGYVLEEDRQVVEALTADVVLARHLDMPIGAPILLVRRLYISTRDRPVAYFKTYFRADRYVYTVKLRQRGAAPPPAKEVATRAGRKRA